MRPILLLLLTGCAVPAYSNDWPNYTNYPVRPTSMTPLGIALDDPKGELDPAKVDAVATAVLQCLQSADIAHLSQQERTDAQCYFSTELAIKHGLTIKVAPDWYVSACTGEQIFPCSVPNASCEAKQESPTPQCPCSCRAIIQDHDVIVTAPNMRVVPAQLVTLMTGCNMPWTPTLAVCSTPPASAQ
jgi:hypothetical protein